MPAHPGHRAPTLAPARPAPPRRPPVRASPPSVDTVLATVASLHPAWSARGCKLDGSDVDSTAPTPDTAAAALRAVATVAPRAGRGARGDGPGVPSLLRDPRVAGLVQALRVGGQDGDSGLNRRLSPLRAIDALIAVGRLAAGTGGAHDVVLDGCLAVLDAASWAGVAPADAAQIMAALAAASYAPPSALAAADAAVAAGAVGHPRLHARPLGTALWAGAVLQAAPAACLDRDGERSAAAALATARGRGPKSDATTARTLWSLAALGRERGPAFDAALASLAAAAPRTDALSLPTLTQLHVACTAARLAGAVLPATVADIVEDAESAVAARAAKTAKSSALQDSVLNALTRLLGASSIQREGIAPGVGLPVDALLPASRVAIEIDGPHHYVRVPSNQAGPPTLRPDGRTALKTRLLQATGWTVLRVSGAEWDAAGASAEREAWLLQRLVECGAVAG